MSATINQVVQQAKEAKEAIRQVVGDISDTYAHIVNVDPYTSLLLGQS
jgi:hypothetical protein